MSSPDLFSPDFLAGLKEDVRARTKTSKALLDAIKDLSLANMNQKVSLSLTAEEDHGHGGIDLRVERRELHADGDDRVN